MTYYAVESWLRNPITKMLNDKAITFFGGSDIECHLNIPDDQFVYCLTILKTHFDVMILERSGKTYIWLDSKDGRFRQR